MPGQTDKIINKTIDASQFDVPIEGIFMKEKRYALTPLEHRILSDSESKYADWSKNFALISIGIFFTVLSKLVIFLYRFKTTTSEERANLDLDIQTWEITYLIIGFGTSLLLYFISRSNFDNSEKKELMKNIKNFFDAD